MNKLLRKLSLGVACLLMAAFISSCQSSQASGTFEVGKKYVPVKWKAFCSESCGGTLSAYPGTLLGTAYSFL